MKKKAFYSSKFQKEFYDKLSQEKKESRGLFSCGYEERYNPWLIINNENAYNIFMNLFSSSLGEDKDKIVLDLCTGSGIHLPLLSKYSETTIGADLSLELLKRAQEIKRELQLHNIFLLQAQAESIPLADDVCDAVVMIDGIHHVENQEKVMEELRRVAKNHAPFLLIEPNISNPLVFLAHLFPKEERGALRLNTARGLSRLLFSHLDEVYVKPFNYVASRKSSFLGRVISCIIEWLFEWIFFFWPIRLLVQGNFCKKKGPLNV
jgi:SAM-dependent methyltransferase